MSVYLPSLCLCFVGPCGMSVCLSVCLSSGAMAVAAVMREQPLVGAHDCLPCVLSVLWGHVVCLSVCLSVLRGHGRGGCHARAAPGMCPPCVLSVLWGHVVCASVCLPSLCLVGVVGPCGMYIPEAHGPTEQT